MKTKAILKALSIVLSISLIGGLLPDKVANAATLSDAMKPSISANKILTREETSKIESEIQVLDKCVDTAIIKKVNVTKSGNEYTLGYKNIDEKVIIKNSDNESVTIIASDGEKSNEISYMKDGSVIIDGNKIQVPQVNQVDQMDTNIDVAPMGTIYKSVKSFSPYGSLTPSDYNSYLNSGTQNVLLGKAISMLTYTAFTTAIGFINIYAAAMVGLAGIAMAVKDVIQAIDPQTAVLGCKWNTYTAGSDDYQYYNRFYANVACTGSSSLQISYEHFTVY